MFITLFVSKQNRQNSREMLVVAFFVRRLPYNLRFELQNRFIRRREKTLFGYGCAGVELLVAEVGLARLNLAKSRMPSMRNSAIAAAVMSVM